MKQILCARHWTSIEKNHIVRLLRELQTQKDELVFWNKRCYRTRRLLAEGKTLLCPTRNHKYSPTQLSLHGVGSQLITSRCPVLLSSDGQRNLLTDTRLLAKQHGICNQY